MEEENKFIKSYLTLTVNFTRSGTHEKKTKRHNCTHPALKYRLAT